MSAYSYDGVRREYPELWFTKVNQWMLVFQTQTCSLSGGTLFTPPDLCSIFPGHTTMRRLCERNSFTAARFWLQGRPGNIPGMVSGGVAGLLGASKRFCDVCPPPAATQQSRRLHAELQRSACSSFLDLTSTHASKLLEGMGHEEDTYQHECFDVYQAAPCRYIHVIPVGLQGAFLWSVSPYLRWSLP